MDSMLKQNKEETIEETQHDGATRWAKAAKAAADTEKPRRLANLDTGNTHEAYRKSMNDAWRDKRAIPTFRMTHGTGILPTPDDRIENLHPLASIVGQTPEWLGQWGHGRAKTLL